MSNLLQRGATIRKYAAVTRSDTVNIAPGPCDGLYVGTTGNLALVDEDDVVTVVSNVPVGLYPFGCKRVNSTNTTANDIVAVWLR